MKTKELTTKQEDDMLEQAREWTKEEIIEMEVKRQLEEEI